MASIPDSHRPSLPLTCTCGSSYRLILIAGVIRCHDCRTKDQPVTVAPASLFGQYEVTPLNEADNNGWFGYRREG